MASWQHRAVVQKQDVKKLQKSGREPQASCMDESSLECFHWSCAKLAPMRPARPVLSKIQENFELDFHPLGDFSLSGFDITDGFKSIDLPWG